MANFSSDQKYLDKYGLSIFWDKVRQYIQQYIQNQIDGIDGTDVKLYPSGEPNPTVTDQIEKLWNSIGSGLGQYVKDIQHADSQTTPLKVVVNEGIGDNAGFYTITLEDNGLANTLSDLTSNRVSSLTPENGGGSITLKVNENKGDVILTINSQELTNKVSELKTTIDGMVKSVGKTENGDGSYVKLNIDSTTGDVKLSINDQKLFSELTSIKEDYVKTEDLPTTLPNPHELKVIDANGTHHNYNGEETIDLSGGINYAANSGKLGGQSSSYYGKQSDITAISQKITELEELTHVNQITTGDGTSDLVKIGFSNSTGNVVASIDETNLSNKLTTIDDYKINGKKISTNPVLTGSDITLGNSIGDNDNYPIATTLTSSIQKLRQTIAGLGQVVKLKGVLTSLPTTTSGYENGDVIIVGNKEYICYESQWYLLGDTTELSQDVSTIKSSYVKSIKATGTGVVVTPSTPSAGDVTINVDATSITEKITELENNFGKYLPLSKFQVAEVANPSTVYLQSGIYRQSEDSHLALGTSGWSQFITLFAGGDNWAQMYFSYDGRLHYRAATLGDGNPENIPWTAIITEKNIGDYKLSQFTDDVVAGKYLPLSGGTLSNAAWRSQLTIERSGSANDSVIAFKNSNGLLGCLGYRGADGVPSVWLGETGTGTPIIHANNIGNYNAGSATKLQTPRSLWGQSFDGTGNITGPLCSDTWRIITDATFDGAFFQSKNYDGTSNAGNIYLTGWDVNTLESFNVRANDSKFSNNVTVAGNVGIGTTSPTEKLDVAGNVKASGDITANKFIGHLRGDIIYDNGVDEGHFIGLGSNGVGVKGLLNYVYGNFPILFYTNGFERMRIGDYVGIGTTSPTEKLDVAGNVKANSFIGNASSASKLANYYTSRPSSANLTNVGDGAVSTFKATSNMSIGAPQVEGHILHFEWDNSGLWNSQLCIANNDERVDGEYLYPLRFRTQGGYDWDQSTWHKIALINETHANALINSLSVGASDATLDDYIICQYAGGGTTTNTYHRRKLRNLLTVNNYPGINKTGTVTSVGLSMPTGFSVSSSPITSSGTLSVSFASGYSLPTTAKQTNWDTAYGWGNHASAGYKKTDTNYYHTRSYSSGLQISTGTGVSNMYVPYATASQAGVVSTGSQTFAGDKTFNSTVRASAFYIDSDERLKTFGDDIKVDFDELAKLRKSHFVFNNNPTKQEIGVSAQEVQKIYPEIVNETEEGTLSVDYSKLAVVALAAIDKLNQRVQELENKLAKYE